MAESIGEIDRVANAVFGVVRRLFCRTEAMEQRDTVAQAANDTTITLVDTIISRVDTIQTLDNTTITPVDTI